MTGWTAVVIAISTGVIALILTVCAVALLRWLREMAGVASTVQRVVESLDQEARPALRSARTLTEDTSRIVATVRTEVERLSGSSKNLRERVDRAVQAAEERLRDLEAVVDMVQYEIEETALDVAAALRTTRRGASILRTMKRALFRRRR